MAGASGSPCEVSSKSLVVFRPRAADMESAEVRFIGLPSTACLIVARLTFDLPEKAVIAPRWLPISSMRSALQVATSRLRIPLS